MPQIDAIAHLLNGYPRLGPLVALVAFMIAITRERGTRRIVLTTHGELNDEAVTALLEALALTDDDAPIVIDLADAGELKTTRDIGLMSALAFRSGAVAFRGAHRNHRRLVSAAQSA